MATGPLFRWSKRVKSAQVEEWENRLTIAGIAYAVEHSVGRELWHFTVYGEEREALESMKQRYGGGVSRVRPEDWEPSTSDQPVRLKIRDRLLVVEETDQKDLARLAEEYPERDLLSFPPQMAFGTGGHQTTATCLRLLVDEAARRSSGTWEVLDLGSGSGILAVAGIRLGASRVVAVENDPQACEVAAENLRRHDCEAAVDLVEGDAIGWARDAGAGGIQCDIVAANLFSDLLVSLFPHVPGVLKPGGTVIVSGFLTSQARAVNEAARKAGIHLKNFARRGKWVTAVGQSADR